MHAENDSSTTELPNHLRKYIAIIPSKNTKIAGITSKLLWLYPTTVEALARFIKMNAQWKLVL